jgi:hypothetical protein
MKLNIFFYKRTEVDVNQLKILDVIEELAWQNCRAMNIFRNLFSACVYVILLGSITVVDFKIT